MMHGYGMGGGMGFGFGWIFWLVILGVIVWLAVTLVNRSGGVRPFGHEVHDAPLDVLRRRYARGEISKEEFREMKAALRS